MLYAKSSEGDERVEQRPKATATCPLCGHVVRAILREIERFILELGAGFAFVERQKRITLEGDDYYLDLLFFHRRMQRLVAIELEIGDFKPAHSGQMELYLRWLDRHERQPSEQAPLGIILCAGKKRETVEYRRRRLEADTRVGFGWCVHL